MDVCQFVNEIVYPLIIHRLRDLLGIEICIQYNYIDNKKQEEALSKIRHGRSFGNKYIIK